MDNQDLQATRLELQDALIEAALALRHHMNCAGYEIAVDEQYVIELKERSPSTLKPENKPRDE